MFDLGAGLGMMCCCFAVPLAVYVPMIIGMWKVYEKAGEPGWTSLVPLYNVMVLARIVGRDEVYGLMCLIPVAGVYFVFILLMELCELFDKEAGYAMGLLLLGPVFWPMLGFGDARFRGKGGRRRSSRARPRRARRRDEDDYDDYDDEPRRPRRRRRPREDDYDDDY